MRVVKLETMFQASEWRRQFADHLIRLQPEMNPDAADEVSDEAYRLSHRLPPAEAARRFAEARLGRPSDGGTGVTPPESMPQASSGGLG